MTVNWLAKINPLISVREMGKKLKDLHEVGVSYHCVLYLDLGGYFKMLKGGLKLDNIEEIFGKISFISKGF